MPSDAKKYSVRIMIKLKSVVCFYLFSLTLMNFSTLASDRALIDEISVEIVVSDPLNVDVVCQSLGPVFASQGPWGFGIANHLKCSLGDGTLQVNPTEPVNSWKVFAVFNDQLLQISICRNMMKGAKIDSGFGFGSMITSQTKCEASLSVPAANPSLALSIFNSQDLVTVIAASLYDQLPIKSKAGLGNIGTHQFDANKDKLLAEFPDKYPGLLEAVVYLNQDLETFDVDVSENSDKKKMWIISTEERGAKKDLFNQLIKKILEEKPPKSIEIPVGRFSAYSSLFPPAGSTSELLPPALFEMRMQAELVKPLFGFQPNFEFGLRKMLTYMKADVIKSSGDTGGNVSTNSINKIYEDSYHYYLGTDLKFFIYDYEIKPSIAFGINHSKLKTVLPNLNDSSDTSTYNASAIKFGVSGRKKLFSLPLIGQVTAEGHVRSGFSKSSRYSQKWLSASGGGSLLVPPQLVPAWSHLAMVSLEGYGEITSVTTEWKWDQNKTPGETSVTSNPIVAIFGISSYWY